MSWTMALALARAAHQPQFMAAASQRWRAVDAVDACRSQSPRRRAKAPETMIDCRRVGSGFEAAGALDTVGMASR